MRRIHVAIGVADVALSVEDYSRRLGAPPSVLVAGEYALWRTPSINLSIRRSEQVGVLRHLGWEDSSAEGFSCDTDVNGIVWELFNATEQDREILKTWPHAKL